MTTDTQLPKLSTLSPERRRILCAEMLGWKQEANTRPVLWFHPKMAFGHMVDELPDPDLNPSDALALVEHAAKNGWRCECNCGTAFHWECIFHRDLNADEQKIQRDHSMMAAHNEGLIGMPQGPCQCDICQCRRIEHYAPADTFCEAITSAFLLATGKAEL